MCDLDFGKTHMCVRCACGRKSSVRMCVRARQNIVATHRLIFLQNGWFLQNLEKEAVRTNMHTTVDALVATQFIDLCKSILQHQALAIKQKNVAVCQYKMQPKKTIFFFFFLMPLLQMLLLSLVGSKSNAV